MQMKRAADGSFEVSPSTGRQIIERFVDHETGYLVIGELCDDPADREVHCSLIDQRTGEIISPSQRQAMLPKGEQVTVDAAHGLQLTSRREINLRTGAESLHERLIEIASGRELARSHSIALAAKPRPTLLQTHFERLAEAQASRAFWDGEYRDMTLAQRQAWWLHRVMLHMRMQGESGLDEYAIFTPEAYADWQSHDPEIDLILDFVSEHLPDGDARNQIDLRIGRRSSTR